MANVKITELTAATALAATDVLPIVDVGADATKKVSVSDLLRNLPDGTASAPALAFADDQNTGVLSPAANELAFATSGTQQLLIDSSGRLLAGATTARSNFYNTTTNYGRFQIEGVNNSSSSLAIIQNYDEDTLGPNLIFAKNNSRTIGSNVLVDDDDTLGAVSFQGNDGTNFVDAARITSEIDGTAAADDMPGRLVFHTNGGSSSVTERVRIDSSGNCGIGTTLPQHRLSVERDIGIYRASSDPTLSLSVGGTISSPTKTYNLLIDDSDSDKLQLRDGSTARVTLDGSGNFGIGTASPATELHLESASPAIRFTDSDTTDYSEIIQSGPGLFINADRGNEGDGSIIFRNGGSSERARIDSSGRLLVGHSSSTNVAAIQSQLQVVGADAATGSIAIRRDQNVASGPLLVFGKSRGSRGGNTAVQANDIIGAVLFNAADGTDVTTSAARIKAEVDGTPGSNDMPGRLVFETTANGASSLTERMRIDSSGQIDFNSNSRIEEDGVFKTANGSAAAPSHAFLNDPDNGMFRATTNTLGFATGGSERLRIDSSGNVGIGTTSNLLSNSTRTTLSLNNTGSAAVALGVSGTREGHIFADANSMEVSATDNYMYFTAGSSERMRIDTSGRLLVGTSSDVTGSTHHVVQAVTTGGGRITLARNDTSVTAGDTIGQIGFSGNDSNGSYQQVANITCEADGTHGDDDKPGRLRFLVTADNAGSATERMRIDSSGRVLVGTATAGHGSADNLTIADGGHCGITIRSGTSSEGAIYFSDGTTGTAEYRGQVFYDHDGNYMRFSTNSSERMRINSSGQVLVGQTSATSVLGTGVGIKSGTVGSAYNTGALSLTGGGGDFYGLTFNKTAASNAEAFGFLSVYSNVTHSLRVGYNDGSTNTTIALFYENGNFQVQGALSKGSGSFRIDHPLPAKTETHDLVHSFIEGPQADLIYRGKVDLVAGAATVNLDTAARMTEGTFVLLNTNVQCFTSNESDWTAVRGSVSGNTLTIAAEDNTSTATVSWMVIGERQDQHMLDTDWTDDNGRVITEPEKAS